MKREIKDPLFGESPFPAWTRDNTEPVDWIDATTVEQCAHFDVELAAGPLASAARSQLERG